jgi:hypothetical protein
LGPGRAAVLPLKKGDSAAGFVTLGAVFGHFDAVFGYFGTVFRLFWHRFWVILGLRAFFFVLGRKSTFFFFFFFFLTQNNRNPPQNTPQTPQNTSKKTIKHLKTLKKHLKNTPNPLQNPRIRLQNPAARPARIPPSNNSVIRPLGNPFFTRDTFGKRRFPGLGFAKIGRENGGPPCPKAEKVRFSGRHGVSENRAWRDRGAD